MKMKLSVPTSGLGLHEVLLFLWAMLSTVLLVGCVSQKPVSSVHAGTPSTTAPILLEIGPIGVIASPTPAEFRFDKVEGRIQSAGDAARHAAGAILETPTADDPAVEMAAGAVRFALAPLVAVAG